MTPRRDTRFGPAWTLWPQAVPGSGPAGAAPSVAALTVLEPKEPACPPAFVLVADPCEIIEPPTLAPTGGLA